MPLGNYDTRESLTREMLTTLYMHSRTMQTLLASERYFAIIEPILKKYGVPDDFKYLCMAESGLNPEARSGAGAAGLWQLSPRMPNQQACWWAARSMNAITSRNRPRPPVGIW